MVSREDRAGIEDCDFLSERRKEVPRNNYEIQEKAKRMESLLRSAMGRGIGPRIRRPWFVELFKEAFESAFGAGFLPESFLARAKERISNISQASQMSDYNL